MTLRFTIILVMVIAAFNSLAQKPENTGTLTTSETAELIQGDFIEFETLLINDVVQLRQIGNLNQLTAVQQLDNPSVYILTAEQNGNNNIGYIDQSGNMHESLLLQKGNNNLANLISQGNNTQNRVLQDGNGNEIESLIENYTLTQRSATSLQVGNNNEIILNFYSGIDNPTPFGLLIDQDGNNNMADVTIDNYNVPYIKIEQTGGAKVIIHNSDFNYPTK